MGTLCGFAPWLVYWVLVANVPFPVAAVTALVIAVASLAAGRVTGASGQMLDVGAVATFTVVTTAAFALEESVLQRWILPLSIVGVLAVAVVAAATGKPFLRAPAAGGPPTDVTSSELFAEMGTRVTRIWVAALAFMAVSSVVAPIVAGYAAILESRTPLVVVCTWVIPFVAFCVGAVASRTLEDRVIARLANPETVRRTTFVAYKELAIDELYYLAREKADREVGAGMEAYDVSLGSAGVTLTGDESRESWPASYKVRARR